ncbi:MAG: 30S ribosome-binding factor RbfA [Gammaproteobacteria bacterium]|jgi:ribosome-binding factor A|nr:30S ribosome-binding factor RbfA [Gammaproteobacteria bacterium]
MPRDFPRSRRIEDQIQRILSDVIRMDLRDPRLDGVFITAVRVSRDLGVAWVYYSVLTSDAAPSKDLATAFDSAMGFLRSRLAKELTVRRVPELRFELDDTVSSAAAMDRLIDDAVAGERDPAAGKPGKLDD